MTQRDLAARSGVSQPAIAAIESGILILPDGRWAAIEVKLSDSPEAVSSAIKTLNAMTDQVADSRCAFKAVITNGGTIRTKGDIHIIPITHLGP
ncbi:hypothetical protein GCM10027059_10110 [Myceligenerans halotolerans]